MVSTLFVGENIFDCQFLTAENNFYFVIGLGNRYLILMKIDEEGLYLKDKQL